MATTPAANTFEFDDLQALIRYAHGRLSDTRFLLLDVIDAAEARAWLESVTIAAPDSASPGVTITTAVPAHQPRDTAMQVAFTASGLRALAISDTVIDGFSDEFVLGMTADASRSRRLGDVGDNDPKRWEWGGLDDESPHLLLMLYARPGGLPKWDRAVGATPHFAQAFRRRTTLPTNRLRPEEPFGFADGISQPEIDWNRELSTDAHTRDRYTNRLAVGEVVLGYPNEYGRYTDRPLIDPKSDSRAAVLPTAEDDPDRRDFGRNGCYLVVRQLHQDVPKFWRFIDDEAGSDAAKREQLAAVMVGRQRNGKPLVPPTNEPIQGIERGGDSTELNQFTFENDPDGHQCPIGAHIRRSNPRTGDFPQPVTGLFSRLVQIFGFGRGQRRPDLVASARFHRLVRRGRTYGPRLSPEGAVKPAATQKERGLEFICLVANISRQFEFVQHAWSMSTKFGGVPDESDPLLGNRAPLSDGTPTDHFHMPQADGPAHCIEGLPQFITVRGGAYFFMPGMRALRYIAQSGTAQSRSQS